jgi:hypothetical protein
MHILFAERSLSFHYFKKRECCHRRDSNPRPPPHNGKRRIAVRRLHKRRFLHGRSTTELRWLLEYTVPSSYICLSRRAHPVRRTFFESETLLQKGNFLWYYGYLVSYTFVQRRTGQSWRDFLRVHRSELLYMPLTACTPCSPNVL